MEETNKRGWLLIKKKLKLLPSLIKSLTCKCYIVNLGTFFIPSAQLLTLASTRQRNSLVHLTDLSTNEAQNTTVFPWNAGVLPAVSMWEFPHLCKINSIRTATVVYTDNVIYLHTHLCCLQLALFSATLYASSSALLKKQLSISASHLSESYSLKWKILSEYWSTVLTQVLLIYQLFS